MRPRIVHRRTTTEEVMTLRLDGSGNPASLMAFAMQRAKDGWRMKELNVTFERSETEFPDAPPLPLRRAHIRRRRK